MMGGKEDALVGMLVWPAHSSVSVMNDLKGVFWTGILPRSMLALLNTTNIFQTSYLEFEFSQFKTI